MFEDIAEYIKKPRDERRSHLDLSEPCIKIGGYDSRKFRGLLAHHLHTTIPTGLKIALCHACNDHWCSNPHHMYWGTYKENSQDAVEAGRTYKPTTFVNAKTAGSKGGKNNRGRPKAKEHRRRISESLKNRARSL